MRHKILIVSAVALFTLSSCGEDFLYKAPQYRLVIGFGAFISVTSVYTTEYPIEHIVISGRPGQTGISVDHQ